MKSSDSIQIWVNGEPRSLPSGTTVRGLLDYLGAPREGVAVERNRVLVKRADHEATAVENGDRLEVVTFVGGG
jgi:thiamine biosynthesis protein ThiS